MLICIICLPLLCGVIWVVTRSKINLDSGISQPEEEIFRSKNATKARLVAERIISHEESGETTTFEKDGEISVWLTDAKDPLYDTVVVTLEPLDDPE